MKTPFKILITTAVMAFVLTNVNAQNSYEFEYDAAGNRISRTIVITMPPAAQKQKEMQPASVTEQIGEQEITIYPNPTTGELVIQVTNMQSNVESSIRVFDISGKEVLMKSNISEYTRVDLTGQRSGTYVLIIKIGEEISEWNVVKN